MQRRQRLLRRKWIQRTEKKQRSKKKFKECKDCMEG